MLSEGSDASPSPGDSLHTEKRKLCSSLCYDQSRILHFLALMIVFLNLYFFLKKIQTFSQSPRDAASTGDNGFSEPSGIIISNQTPARFDEEMEAALTDMSKCGLEPWATGVGPFLLCPCHPLIQLSCNNNKSEVYRLFWAEWKKRGSFINIAGAL